MHANDATDVRELCERWGPVLERFFEDHDLSVSQRAGAPTQAEVIASVTDAGGALERIEAAQRGGAHADGLAAILDDPATMRTLEVALVRIRAWSAQD
ncbi:MAG TPA: hypothetical protein VK646_04535 [Actinomycetota bacterium]|nr:hypothetical protein [Actinomycetota bacterium]